MLMQTASHMHAQSHEQELAQNNLRERLRTVQRASRTLTRLSEKQTNKILLSLADALALNVAPILAANAEDCARMDSDNPKYDRLLLTETRLHAIASDVRALAYLPSPLGKTLDSRTLPNALQLTKVSVPMGVVGMIYEARPNVTVDVFALCLKSGNACVLKGGSDAHASNSAIMRVVHAVLAEHGVSSDVAFLMPASREATDVLFNAVGVVDVIIPRGSQSLINAVREQSRVPVIETGAGIVHTYFDASGDAASGAEIVFNAKTRRVSVCNALDTLLVHRSRLADLPALVEKLPSKNVVIYADNEAYTRLQDSYPNDLLREAAPEHFGTEFLDYKMSVKIVADLDDALEHIAEHSSRHSEAIVASDAAAVERFLTSVDAACVYANASTAFTDGGQFGMGAEIGISTQKLHARGPMALPEITSYKWIVRGAGQIRP
jgi:glutamate-5-semialdehyde dehydrogenase